MKKQTLFILFSLSGFAGLIYESVWSHYVKLILGHAAYAQILVLILFMGGMAAGAWITSRNSKRISNPLIAYAAVEAVIGLFGFGFDQEFRLFESVLFEHLLPLASEPGLRDLCKWSVAAALLLPQAILLGATFPLMSAGIVRMDLARGGHSLGLLYFSNSIGAAVGVLVSAFFLIESFGLPGTSMIAGIINLLLALAVWLIARGERRASIPTAATSESANSARILLLVALLTGTASFFYEIGWIRMLSLVLGASTQAFELMLSAFITGLALGSFYIRKRIDGLGNPGIYLAFVQILMAVFAIATLPLYATSFSVMSALLHTIQLNEMGYAMFNFGSHAIALGVMLPATFMAGMTLPLLTATLMKMGKGESSIGQIYATNTLGAIVGVAAASHLAMPNFGVKGVIVIGAGIDLFLGVILLWRYREHLARLPLAAAALACAWVFAFSLTTFDPAVLASGVYRFGRDSLLAGDSVIYYRDGKTASVAVIQHGDESLAIRTNGKTDARLATLDNPYTSDEPTMILAGVLANLFIDKPKQVANIGLGSGLTTHTLLGWDSIERLDTIEIEPAMIEGAQLYGERVSRVYNDPRSHLHIEDAKAFFSSQQRTYDIIVSEPSNPWVSGVASLFTVEFYQHLVPQLSERGVFVQWVQLYEIDIENIASVVKALGSVFVDYRLFNANDGDLLLVASKVPMRDANYASLFDNPAIAQALARIGVRSDNDIANRYLGSKAEFSPFFESFNSPVNSDYFPYLSFSAPRNRFLRRDAVALARLHLGPEPILQWLHGTAPSASDQLVGTELSFKQARSVARNVVHGELGGDSKLRFTSKLIADTQELCATPADDQDLLIESLFSAGVALNAYLPREQLADYWRSIISRCSLPGHAVGRWTNLQLAVADRDIATVQGLSQELIESEVSHSAQQFLYLQTMHLLTLLLEGRYDELVSRVDEWGIDPTGDLRVRLIVSMAIANKQLQP